jgi:RNA polymerase sigma-70 factor, ECF subfamily
VDYERLVARHKDAIYRQMVRLCGNHDDAEDVLAEALLAAFKAKENLRDEESFRGWLAIIGRRVCGRLRKRESSLPIVRIFEEIEAVQPESALDDITERETKDCILRAVSSLPQSYREAYELIDIDGLSAKEAAARLKTSVAAVKSRLHRARTMVRKALDEALCHQALVP